MSDREPRYVLLGRPEQTEAWCRQQGIPPGSRRVIRIWHNAGSLRGVGGPVEVLTFTSWAATSQGVRDEVEHHLAVIRATTRTERAT